MASTTPELPTRFPCWCRAVYSWGGETDRDLGFVEGDLIECLNAGDGSWWMGRLRRDRRMIGLFPSNFVMVLDDSFQPTSRATSPMPELHQNQPRPQKSKMRKPFSGYKNTSPSVPTPPKTSPRLPPHAQEEVYDVANPPSTVLWNMESTSPRPSRSPSPMPHNELGSSPPPPPPPHGIAPHSRMPSPQPLPQPLAMNDRYMNFSRTPSPHPPSLNGHTPPMLRHAMDDVMSSLEDMGMARRESQTETSFNPWSPEAFDELHKPSVQRLDQRPLTSLGLGAGGSNYSYQHGYSSNHNSPDRYDDGPAQLSNYVQRMESRLRQMQDQTRGGRQDLGEGPPPAPPPKNSPFHSRPTSAMAARRPSIRNRKSAYELGRAALGRTFTIKSNTTNSSSGIQSNATASSTQTSMTSQSIMSGHSAGAFSATSAGSLARRNGWGSIDKERPMTSNGTHGRDHRPHSPLANVAFAPSRDSRQGAQSAVGWEGTSSFQGGSGGLGGLSTPRTKKTGFFKKLIEGAKTGAASARSNIAVGQAGMSPPKATFGNGLTGIAGGTGFTKPGQGRDAAREMGLGGGNSDWLKMRQDVNRSNTPGPTERQERADRCLMLDHPVICPMDELFETAEGDEGADGLPVPDPFPINNPGLSLVDKAARFITSVPPMTNATSLAQGYVCRPHRSDVQRLRAIFTWVSERVAWEEDFEGEIDTRRVVQSKRGCSHELAALVVEMCHSINIHAEVVRGHLKTPGGDLDLDALNRPNHYWNAILVDNEWRIMDCSLASPTNPRRTLFSSISPTIAEPFYFLAKPLETCYTHIPLDAAQQHIVPPISPDVLLALPCALPSYFRQSLSLHAYDTSLIRMEGLEMCTISVNVPPDVDVVAEVETSSFLHDLDGDVYENSDAVTKKRALAQASWYTPPSNPHILQKRYIVKAVLPGDEGKGALKVYAGKKGLMHSSKDIPYPLAMVLPLYHQGENPAYEFLIRHPTPHATRQDLYVLQPQCKRLCAGETYIFAVRQHAASVIATPAMEQGGFDGRPVSPNPTMRPASAMSMTSSAAGSGSGSGEREWQRKWKWKWGLGAGIWCRRNAGCKDEGQAGQACGAESRREDSEAQSQDRRVGADKGEWAGGGWGGAGERVGDGGQGAGERCVEGAGPRGSHGAVVCLGGVGVFLIQTVRVGNWCWIGGWVEFFEGCWVRIRYAGPHCGCTSVQTCQR